MQPHGNSNFDYSNILVSQVPIMKLFTFFFALVFALFYLSITAKACRCGPSSMASSFSRAEKALIGTVVRKSGSVDYTIRVLRSFKECVRQGSRIIVNTPSSSASCGVRLRVGSVYYLSINSGSSIRSCSYNREAGKLTPADIRFLRRESQC